MNEETLEARTARLLTMHTEDFQNSSLSFLSEDDTAAALYLANLQIPKAVALRNSGLEVHYAYQILADLRRASRDKWICLCIGAGYSVELTNEILERAELGSLYPYRKRDAILIVSIHQGLHTVWQVNTCLQEYQQKLLG